MIVSVIGCPNSGPTTKVLTLPISHHDRAESQLYHPPGRIRPWLSASRTTGPARPPERSRRPRGASPCQDRPAPPSADGGASLSPDPASPAASAPRASSAPRRSSLRRRFRSLGRHARAAVLALACLAALALAGAGAARADVLVSNIEQTFSANESAGQVAQSFTTGDNTAGYRLTSVEVKLGSPRPASSGNGIQVRIAPELTGNLPDLSNAASIITLSNPATVSASSDNTFNAPANTTLGADTTYYVVVTSANGEDYTEYRYHRTDSDAEDADSASGWSIGDTRVSRSSSSTSWNANSAVLLIRVNGTAHTAGPTAADKTVTMPEGTTYAFTAADFGFVGADPSDRLESVRVVTAPPAGTLALDGPGHPRYFLATRAEIDAGDLTFTPAAGASGTPYASFTFKVNDGTDDSASAYTMTIDVTPDAPCAEPNFGDRRNFWSGTVTVRPLVSFVGTSIETFIGHGYSRLTTGGSSLLPDSTFSIGANNYEIFQIVARTSDLNFS